MKHRLMLIVVLALALAACGSREERIAESLRKGHDFVHAGDLHKAGLEVRNVLQIDPKNGAAYVISGRIDEARSEWNRAFGAYRKAIELAPGDLDAKAALARLLLFAGDHPQAASLVREVLDNQPTHAGARAVQAALRAAGGERDAAIGLAEALLAERSHATPAADADAAMLLAGLHAEAGRPDAALAVVERTLAQQPTQAALATIAARIAAAPGVPAAVSAQADGLFRRAAQLAAAEVKDTNASAAGKALAVWSAWAAWHDGQGRGDAAEAVWRQAVAAQPGLAGPRLALIDQVQRQRGLAAAVAAADEARRDQPREVAFGLKLAALQRSAGRADEADAVLDRAIADFGTDPAGLAARNALAAAHHAAGRSDAARQRIEEVLAANPRDSAALALRGRMALEAGQPQPAIADLRAALKDEPGSADFAARLAQAHQAAGEPRLARDVLDEAAALSPRNVELAMLRVALLLDSRDLPAADAAAEQAARANPDDWRAHDLRALVALARRDGPAAERVYRELRRQRPNDPVAGLRLARLHERQGRWDAALKEYDAVAAAHPTLAEPRVLAIALSLGQRRFDAAETRLREFGKALPDSPAHPQLLGNLALARGQQAQAMVHYRALVERHPTWPVGYVHLARAQAGAGDSASALATLQAGERAAPEDLTLPMARAEWLSRLARHDEAIALYESLYRRAPQNDTVTNNLGYLLAQTRQDRASLERAAAITARLAGSANGGAIDTHAWALHRLGRSAEALPLLERAAALEPQSAVVRQHLEAVRQQLGSAARPPARGLAAADLAATRGAPAQ
jgi:cellulose synthase operon protein C